MCGYSPVEGALTGALPQGEGPKPPAIPPDCIPGKGWLGGKLVDGENALLVG